MRLFGNPTKKNQPSKNEQLGRQQQAALLAEELANKKKQQQENKNLDLAEIQKQLSHQPDTNNLPLSRNSSLKSLPLTSETHPINATFKKDSSSSSEISMVSESRQSHQRIFIIDEQVNVAAHTRSERQKLDKTKTQHAGIMHAVHISRIKDVVNNQIPPLSMGLHMLRGSLVTVAGVHVLRSLFLEDIIAPAIKEALEVFGKTISPRLAEYIQYFAIPFIVSNAGLNLLAVNPVKKADKAYQVLFGELEPVHSKKKTAYFYFYFNFTNTSYFCGFSGRSQY